MELLHCNRSRDTHISVRGSSTCCLVSRNIEFDSEAEWEELDASQREGKTSVVLSMCVICVL